MSVKIFYIKVFPWILNSRAGLIMICFNSDVLTDDVFAFNSTKSVAWYGMRLVGELKEILCQ